MYFLLILTQEFIFTIYSQMVSCGGFLGYLVTALDWHSMRIGQFFGTQERTVFSLLTVMFLFLFTATIIVAKEEPLSERVVSHQFSLNANLKLSLSNQGNHHS
jgi:solute carrier family 45 protein 3